MGRLLTLSAFAIGLALAGCAHTNNIFWRSDAPSPVAADMAARAAAPAVAPEARRKPFVVIRFEQPDPDYAEPLYAAMSGALARWPDVEFDLVAVTRDADAARHDLAAVMNSLAAMGMPAERLSLAAVPAADDATDEVWIYLR